MSAMAARLSHPGMTLHLEARSRLGWRIRRGCCRRMTAGEGCSDLIGEVGLSKLTGGAHDQAAEGPGSSSCMPNLREPRSGSDHLRAANFPDD